MSQSKIRISQLLQTYGALLTDKQRAALSMYCDCDCSLSEIAAEVGISRQGVRDAIVKGEAALTRFENALQLSQFVEQLTLAINAQDVASVYDVARKFISKE